MADGGLLL